MKQKTIDELQARLTELETELAAVNQNLSVNQAKHSTLLAEKTEIQEKIISIRYDLGV